jgi:copper chaperone
MTLLVQGMTCNHCVDAVTKAVRAVDPDARVVCNIERGEVSVGTRAARTAIRAAIQAAGYGVAA